MTAEQLAAIAGIVLSLLFSYIPGLSDKYASLDPTQKRLIMAGLLLLVAGGVFAGSCGGLWNTVVCTKKDALGLLYVFISALIANQSAYLLSPRKLVVATQA